MKKTLSAIFAIGVCLMLSAGVVNRHPRSPQSTAWSYTELMQTLTTSTADAWTDIDLSAYMPDGAVANIAMHMQCAGASNFSQYAGVRANGSSLERKLANSTYTTVGNNGYSIPVQTDANGIIEYYNDDTTNITFYLIGYWENVTYTEAMSSAYNNTANTTWKDIDISADIVDGRVVTMGMVIDPSSSTYGEDVGVRANGSSLARTNSLPDNGGAGDYSASTMTVKSDASGIVEIYSQYYTHSSFYVMGYFGSNMDYTELFQDISITTYDAWTDKDLSAYLDQDGRVVEITPKGIGNLNLLGGARANGSALNRYWDLETRNAGGWMSYMLTTKSDASGIVELYTDAAAVDHILFGYFK